MIRGIRQETRIRLREQRSASSIPFGKDDLIEQLDRRIFGASGFALVNELVEGLCLTQHMHVLAVAMRDALEELVDVEMVEHACFAAFTGCWVEEATVGVEEGGEASDESCADLVCPECDGADECQAVQTAVMGHD